MKSMINVMSRKTAEELIISGFPKNTAVISFYDPKSKRTPDSYTPLDYTGVCDRVYYVGIHDIDIEILPDYGLTFDTYFSEADELAQFIINSVSMGYDIICQCEYGQSRSAACAAAIKEYFTKNGIEIFADYRYYPNQLVFNKLLSSLKDNSLKYFSAHNKTGDDCIIFEITDINDPHANTNTIFMKRDTMNETGFYDFLVDCMMNDIVFDIDTISKDELLHLTIEADLYAPIVNKIVTELSDWFYDKLTKSSHRISITWNDHT